jgi:hypothetical protein
MVNVKSYERKLPNGFEKFKLNLILDRSELDYFANGNFEIDWYKGNELKNYIVSKAKKLRGY